MTTSTPAAAPPAPPRKRKRGFEGALDMVRSLGLILVVVIPVWFFAQPPDSDEQAVRIVDQSADVQAWTSAREDAPVPQGLPDTWRPTVTEYLAEPEGLRLGWNTAEGQYAGFAATAGPAQEWLDETTGASSSEGTVDVDGEPWERYQEDGGGSVSLSRTFGDVTVVVGTRLATTSDAELLVLARSVAPAA